MTQDRPNAPTLKYSREQYAQAELMLTHGFKISEVARVCRMSFRAVEKLSEGLVMHDIIIYEDEE